MNPVQVRFPRGPSLAPCRDMAALRYTLGALLAFIAFNAFGGGIYGMTGAGGVPTEWLAGSPFTTYFVPGLVLFVVVGGSCIAAAAAVLADKRYARPAALAAAMIVTGWITTQIAIIGAVSWLQPATLLAALLVTLLAWELDPERAPDARRRLARAGRAGV